MTPAGSRPDRKSAKPRISDLELASRLSFFLWSALPDAELIETARKNRLHEPRVLEAQVRRMLADPKSDQLIENLGLLVNEVERITRTLQLPSCTADPSVGSLRASA